MPVARSTVAACSTRGLFTSGTAARSSASRSWIGSAWTSAAWTTTSSCCSTATPAGVRARPIRSARAPPWSPRVTGWARVRPCCCAQLQTTIAGGIKGYAAGMKRTALAVRPIVALEGGGQDRAIPGPARGACPIPARPSARKPSLPTTASGARASRCLWYQPASKRTRPDRPFRSTLPTPSRATPTTLTDRFAILQLHGWTCGWFSSRTGAACWPSRARQGPRRPSTYGTAPTAADRGESGCAPRRTTSGAPGDPLPSSPRRSILTDEMRPFR
jgi:hypothetical protein